MTGAVAANTAVALLAKAPVPGKVKTRFTPPFTPEEASEFARAFLLDSITVVNGFNVDLWLSYLGDESILRELAPKSANFLLQRGNRLDDRISNAVSDLRAGGYKNVVVVAADCPTIDALYFQTTLNALEDNDVVLGPAADGGCVLVALGPNGPDVFLDIIMSTGSVFNEMLERAVSVNARIKVLPVLHDIDTVEELWAADHDGQLSHARHTQRLLWTTGVTH